MQAAAAGTGLSAARSGGSGGGERGAAGVVWLADESLQGPLYGRVAALLPQVLGGGSLAGINARWAYASTRFVTCYAQSCDSIMSLGGCLVVEQGLTRRPRTSMRITSCVQLSLCDHA